jgi:hypothetical protein
MKRLPAIAALLLAGLLGHSLFPKTNTVTEILRLPSVTDTVVVTATDIDTLVETRFRDRVVFNTDTIVLIDTVWVATDTLLTLPPRWRLTALDAGQSVSEPSLVSSDLIEFGDVLTRSSRVEQYPVTLGPVEAIRTDELGVHIDWGEFVVPDPGCRFWCKTKIALGGLAGGVLIWELAR